MAEPQSPFDDDADDRRPAPKRQRRPMWRGNLVTLLALLFALVWVRHLGNLSPGWTWTLVISVLILWGVPAADHRRMSRQESA